MDNLAAFIIARADELEAAALGASPGPWHLNAEGDEVVAVDGVTVAEAFALSGNQQRATAAHIALNDPLHALALAGFVRAVAARWQKARAERHECAENEEQAWLLGAVARDLAAVWSEHPDFKPKWNPQ